MKKFFLLMALVLTAGVVHAQSLNFGQRANLTQAVRLDADFPSNTILEVNGTGTVNGVSVTYYNGWDAGEKKLFWSGDPGGSQEVTIFSHDYITNYLHGRSLLDVFENFVIRAKDASEWKHYYGNSSNGEVTYNSSDNSAITYAVCFYSGDDLLSTMMFWSGDVKIAPLRALCKGDKATELKISEINSIDRVTIKSNSPNGQVYIEEAYFISPYKGLSTMVYRGSHQEQQIINGIPQYNYNSLDEHGNPTPVMITVSDDCYKGYLDRDNIDIGNAYIDPSYLIRSNHLWVEIDETNRTFDMIADGSNKGGTLSFSLPYWDGIDMSEVTFTALDFDRNANVLERCIYENKRVDLHRNPTNNGSAEYIAWTEKARDVLVRDLYNSRYNGPFYDQNGKNALDLSRRGDDAYISDKAIKHVNSIYWQSVSGNTERRIHCQDMSLTKNVIKARTTRKPLEPSMWPNPNTWGFRNRAYPVHPYYSGPNNWSDVVRGDWDPEHTFNYADLSNYNKLRIIGSPNTVFNVRYATSLSGTNVTAWEPELHVKTDANGEVNIDLDIYKSSEKKLYLQVIYFDGLEDDPEHDIPPVRDQYYVNDVELFEGEGREVDLVGSPNPNDPNITANMFHIWNDDANYKWQYGTIVRWTDSGFRSNTGDLGSGDLLYGNGSVDPDKYADLTGYKAIRVYGQGNFRISYNRQDYNSCPQIDITSNGTYAELDISNFEYFHLNSIKVPFGQSSHVDYIKLVEDEEADYILYGNGSCFEQNRAAIDPSVLNAVNDPTAKVIDARARCNNMEVPFADPPFGEVQQTRMPQTANPNVLYIERTNQFESRKVGEHEQQKVENNKPVFDEQGKPVMETVEDFETFNFITPSNLQYNANGSSEYFTSGKYDKKNKIWCGIKLTDGYPFYAPKKIKALNATYTRTFNNANVVNSIILPFAVEAGNDTEKKSAGFYETNVTLKSTTNEGMVGILEKQNVNKGDWLLQFTKKTGTTEPNTPYLYAITTGTGENVFQGVPTEDNKVIIPETPDAQVAAHLNMTNNLPNAEDPTYDFYLRGVYEGTYMEHILFYSAGGKLYRTPFMTVTPFRTIIKSPIPVVESDEVWNASQTSYFESNNVKVVLAFDPNDESMDINSLVADGIFAEDAPIYNLAGQRVNTFDKGIYIVGGKKILVK